MPYKARIVTIRHLLPIPGKDRICAAEMNEVVDTKVIVGSSYSLDKKYVFFHTDIQLSKEFAEANDLIGRKDAQGNRAGGYFDDNRRVKCQKFAGVRSEGFLCDLSAFKFLGEDAVKELQKEEPGYEFDSLKGLRICRKYRIRRQNTKMTKYGTFKSYLREHDRLYILVPVINKVENLYWNIRDKIEDLKSMMDVFSYNNNFQRHPDTDQLRENVKRIPVGSLIIITEKLHGTSARTSLLPDISFEGRLRSLFSKERAHKFYVGTRNVVLKYNQTDPYYKGEIFRWKVANKFTDIEKGEDFSYEIVGYNSSEPLMAVHPLDKIKRECKSIKNFPNPIIYSYGLEEGQCEEYVYKYSKMEKGKVVVQSWDTTVRRCKELGLKTVPELDRFVYDGNVDEFMKRVNKYLANEDLIPSVLHSKTLTEGICIRVEDYKEVDGIQTYEPSWQVYKHKSFMFGILEGYLKDAGIEDDN